MDVAELTPGLWRWTAGHPAWTPADGDEWDAEVGCVYAEIDGGIVLVDPLVPEEHERFWRALDRDVERLGAPIVLTTSNDHTRSAAEIAARYGSGGAAGTGVTAIPTAYHAEIVYWLEPYAAIVPGDVLLGADDGGVRVCPDSWLDGVDPGVLRASLQPLLELPVERILVSHGAPVLEGGREALALALRQ